LKKDEEMKKRIAQRILLSMAYNRETFKDKVEEHVSGALLEFYKAARVIMKDYKLKSLGVEIMDEDAEAFWGRVKSALEIGLG
jgi:hypothetical protein